MVKHIEGSHFKKLIREQLLGDYNRNSDENIMKEVRVKVGPIEIVKNEKLEDKASTSDENRNVDVSRFAMCVFKYLLLEFLR